MLEEGHWYSLDIQPTGIPNKDNQVHDVGIQASVGKMNDWVQVNIVNPKLHSCYIEVIYYNKVGTYISDLFACCT